MSFKNFLSSIICLFLFAPVIAVLAIDTCPTDLKEVICAPGDIVIKCVIDPKVDPLVYKNYKCLLGSDIAKESNLGIETTDIRYNIRIAILYSLGFLGVLCVIMIIYGGLVWLTSQGNSDKIKKGRDILIWSAVGVIVISIAWTIAAYMLKVGEMVS